MQQNDRRLAEMVDALAKLPETDKEPGLHVNLELPDIECVCGKKIKLIDRLETLNTGVLLTVNNVCKGCREGHRYDKAHARIICAKCKRVVQRVKPFKDPIDHFEYKAGHNYHTDGCPQCTGQDGAYKVIEKFLYRRKNKLT